MIALLILSAGAIVAFYIQNTTGIFALSNLSEAISSTNMLDGLLGWTYILLFAAIILVFVLSIINMAGNRKALKRTGLLLILTIVLVVVSYVLASGDPVAVNLATEPTAGELKMTDTLLILTYLLMAGSFIALIWGGAKKLIQNR
jgi:TRAP-type C4-dicarboxylate transport system permease small subunit